MKNLIYFAFIFVLLWIYSSCKRSSDMLEPDTGGPENVVVYNYFDGPDTNSYSGNFTASEVATLQKIPSNVNYIVYFDMNAVLGSSLYKRVYDDLMTNWLATSNSANFQEFQDSNNISLSGTGYIDNIIIAGNGVVEESTYLRYDYFYLSNVFLTWYEWQPGYASFIDYLWFCTGCDGSYISNQFIGTNWVYYYTNNLETTNRIADYKQYFYYVYADGEQSTNNPRQKLDTNFQTIGDIYLYAKGTFTPLMVESYLFNNNFLYSYAGINVYGWSGLEFGFKGTGELFATYDSEDMTNLINIVAGTSVQGTYLYAYLEKYSLAAIYGVSKIDLLTLYHTAFWGFVPDTVKNELNRFDVYFSFGFGINADFDTSATVSIIERSTKTVYSWVEINAYFNASGILSIVENNWTDFQTIF